MLLRLIVKPKVSFVIVVFSSSVPPNLILSALVVSPFSATAFIVAEPTPAPPMRPFPATTAVISPSFGISQVALPVASEVNTLPTAGFPPRICMFLSNCNPPASNFELASVPSPKKRVTPPYEKPFQTGLASSN